MKRILFSLLILAIYASANTCTEAVFEYGAYNFIYTKDHAHLDSAYNKETYTKVTYESSDKFVYSNEHLDYFIRTDFKEDGKDSVQITKVYWNSDENVLSKKGVEFLGEIKYSGDTLSFTLTNYYDGKIHEQQTTKIFKKSLEALYPDGPNGELAFQQLYFQNDTLFNTVTLNYGTDSAEVRKKFTVSDEQDDHKCIEYHNDGEISYNLEYVKNEKGYSIKLFDQKNYREYFMVNPENSTAIHQRRAPVKISPKARYFDLLGRYKFSK